MNRPHSSLVFLLILAVSTVGFMLSCGGNSNTCGFFSPTGVFVSTSCATPVPPLGPHIDAIDIFPGTPVAASPTALPPSPFPTSTAVVIPEAVQLHAIGTFVKGKTQSFSDITNSATWFSNNANVLFTTNGVFDSVSPGCSCIFASSGGLNSEPFGIAIGPAGGTPPACAPCIASTPAPTPSTGAARALHASASAISSGIRVEWTRHASDLISGRIAASPDGRVYFLTADGILHALDSAGRQIFSHPGSGTTPLIAPDGMIYVEGPNGGLFQLGSSGATRWFAPIGRGAGPMAIGKDGEVYAGADSHLVAVSSSGVVDWRFAIPGLSQVLTTGQGAIIAVTQGGLAAFSADGSVGWTFAPATGLAGEAAVLGDAVYAVSADGVLHALDADSGGELWHASIGEPVVSGLQTMPSGVVYAGQSAVHAYDAEGKAIWSAAEIQPGVALATDQNGAIFIADESGHIAEYDTDGQLHWIGADFGKIASMALSSSDRLFISSKEGYIYELKDTNN